MSASDYFAGLVFFVATYAAIAAATELVVRRRLARLRGATRAVAWALIATAFLLASHLVPAALTILSRETALVAALALTAVVAALVRERQAPPPAETARTDADETAASAAPPAAPEADPWERLIALAGLVAAGAWLVYTLVRYRTHEPLGFDAAAAYFPTAARWLQEGSIWQIADWVPNAFYGSGPGNGSVVTLSTMLPWDNDFLAHLAMYPFVVLFALALYALAHEMGANRPCAALLALMVPAAPVVLQHGLSEGLLDPVMYFSLAAGVLFLVRHHRTGARADLLLAGLALGICFGTKFYGYTSVAAVVAVWAGARLLVRVRPADVARQVAIVGALVLAAGGIWMVRNWVETGSPVMPVPVEPLGITIFDAPRDPQREIFGFTLLDYATDPGIWVDTLAHQFRIAAGWALIPIAASVLAAAVLVVRRLRAGPAGLDGVAAALLTATLLLCAVYAVTPYTAAGEEGNPAAAAINVRYGIPAAILAIGLIGWLAGRLTTRWRIALCAAALVGTIDALRVGPVNPPSVAWACLAVGVAVAVAVAVFEERLSRLRMPRLDARRLAGGAAAVLLLGALAGYALEENFNDDRYTGRDEVIDAVIAASDEDGARVGLAGFWNLEGVVPIYPSFGPRLQNRVDFVGRRVDDALLRRFDAREPFLAELARQDPELLIVGREGPSRFDPDRGRASADRAEIGWAESAGYREIARSDRFVLLAPVADPVS